MSLQDDPFVRAITDIERALSASHIAAFPVYCCGPSDDLSTVRQKMDRAADDFSHVPVRGPNDRISAVLYRKGLEGLSGPAREHAREVGPEHLIDSRDPLLTTIDRLRQTEFLLVVSPESGHADGVSGIINHADLQKLPVRLLLFARISELEARLRRVIAPSRWEARKDCAEEKEFAEQLARRFDSRLPIAHHLNLRALGLIAFRVGQFASAVEETTLLRRLERLRVARNTVAHGNDFENREVEGPAGTVQAVKDAFDEVEWALGQLG